MFQSKDEWRQSGTCTSDEMLLGPKKWMEPWLVWLTGLSAGLQTQGLSVQFPVRAHAWVKGQVPSRVRARGNHTSMFLSLSFSLPSPL